jgi:hypothetical protein
MIKLDCIDWVSSFHIEYRIIIIIIIIYSNNNSTVRATIYILYQLKPSSPL